MAQPARVRSFIDLAAERLAASTEFVLEREGFSSATRAVS